MSEPRYGGVYPPKASPEDIEDASNVKPPTHTWKSGETAHAHGVSPSVTEVTSKAARLWEPAEEARHEGAYIAKNPGSVDMKDVIDKMCHKNCHAAWEEYEKCEARIEKKARRERAQRTRVCAKPPRPRLSACPPELPCSRRPARPSP